jgi:hypothetical protein
MGTIFRHGEDPPQEQTLSVQLRGVDEMDRGRMLNIQDVTLKKFLG